MKRGKLVLLSGIIILSLIYCTFSVSSDQQIHESTGKKQLTICIDPRPQACTMDYTPVCGERRDGTRKTYSNGCTACSDHEVVGYTEGECKNEKL